ncbi:UNVERIFIED_CONTAM: radical SAM-linked protein [Murimonas intestini]|uniref:Radical SAM-linked protein n=2 Tax=Murimonas intestini TaxID=1337051 RepID=A0AB73TAJ0_9FIRM
MKFIGHLDIMRYFQKAIRRADIDIVYSEGFSPHMIMSFAAPLGVGLTSNGEYMDIEVKGSLSSREAIARLNAVMADGIEILSWRQVPEGKAGKAMSLVAAADYTVTVPRGIFPENMEKDASEMLESFMGQKEITIIKKSKKSEKEADIKPMIYRFELLPEDKGREEGLQFKMQLATGSSANLKPELVMEAFAAFARFELPPFAIRVNRDEVYADTGAEGCRNLVSLEELGDEVG